LDGVVKIDMGVNKNYHDINLSVHDESEDNIRHEHDINVESKDSLRHIHNFETEDKKCKVCGKTIEELLEDI
jgi:formamidopyrimidine-DNA glycosylase